MFILMKKIKTFHFTESYYILIANTIGVFSYNFEKSSFNRFIPKKITTQEKENNGFDEPYIIKKIKCIYY